MSYTDAIADMGDTLVSLLREEFKDYPENSIILASPAEVKPDMEIRLCLYLYQVLESPRSRSLGIGRQSDSGRSYPGLALNLYYMLIPYPGRGSEEQTNKDLQAASREHRTLGKAMRVFHDHAVLHDPMLKGGLAGRGFEFKLALNPISLPELAIIWRCFDSAPYRTSVSYTVSSVTIESDAKPT